MHIIVIGNVVEGFKFFGPFSDIKTEAQAILDEHPEGVWTELQSVPSDEAKYLKSFGIKKVEVARGTFWTVIQYLHTYGDTGSSVITEGGDHHWLSEDAAKSAKRVYEVCTAYHGKSPSEVMEAFGNYFPEEFWPLVEPMY